MCNLYSQTKSQDAMRQVFRDVLEEDEELIDTAGNLAPSTGTDSKIEWIALPTDLAAWSRLTRLLSLGKRRAEKGS